MVAAILAVAAILIVLVLPNDSQKQHDQVKRTNDKISAIRNAVKVIQNKDPNNALPCPAPLNLTPISTSFGLSTGTASTAATASTPAMANCGNTSTPPASSITGVFFPNTIMAIGGVPTKTLGLPDDYAFDEWGNHLTYAMAVPTDPSLATSTLSVKDLSGNSILGIEALIISHGPDSMGAYIRSGSINSTCSQGVMSSTASEYTNCNFESGTFNNFVKDGWHNTNAANYTTNADANFFDDLVGAVNRCPGNVLDCNLWLDGADTTSLNSGSVADGTSITTWKDKSGSVYNATASGSATPTYKTNLNGVNELGVLRFNGSSNVLSLPNVMAKAGAGTVVFVTRRTVSPPTSAATAGPVLGQWGTAPTNGDEWPDTSSNFDVSWGSTTRNTIASTGLLLNLPHFASIISAPNNWQLYVNGSNFSALSSNIVGWGTSPNIGLNSLNNYWFYGDIAELVAYPRVLSTTERQKVEAYLAKKWIPCPGYVPGCTFRLDASDNATVLNSSGIQATNGNSIATWVDKSGGGNNAVQATAGNQPIYNTSGFNSKPALWFNSGGSHIADYLASAFVGAQKNNTSIFVVSQPVGTAIAGPTFQNGNASYGYGVGYGNSSWSNYIGGANTDFVYWMGSVGWARSLSGIGTPANIISSISPSSIPTPVNTTDYLNGTPIATSGPYNNIPYGGSYIGGNTNQHTDVQIAEITFYPFAVTTSQRKAIECYLADKWWGSSSCPSMGGVAASAYCTGIGVSYCGGN